jgi:inhibitor of KinA
MNEPLLHVFRLSALGDRVLMIELGDDASAETALRVRAVSEDLLRRPIAGVLDVVPAVCSVALHYDPLGVEGFVAPTADSPPDAPSPYLALAQQVTQRLTTLNPTSLPEPRTVEVPVCYGREFGEDLDTLARAHALRAEEVIALHAAPLYRVQMIGFAPGFAYLVGLDPRLATPRRPTPRQRVPAGSVAIGGELTGVYPLALPGGWHVIGRSPLRLFAPEQDPPSRLSMGDRVRFVPIDEREYGRLQQEQGWR